jgi:hypothetical protein
VSGTRPASANFSPQNLSNLGQSNRINQVSAAGFMLPGACRRSSPVVLVLRGLGQARRGPCAVRAIGSTEALRSFVAQGDSDVG